MSACKCEERERAPQYRNWVVYQRNCNHSAFNGYHRTPSDYSSVHCKSCLSVWRTKANYVDLIPDGGFEPTGDKFTVQQP